MGLVQALLTVFFVPADPEDVDCNPPLHHVSPAGSQGASPGLVSLRAQ